MKIYNPYRPGAGQMPLFLAGREKEIEEIENVFDMLNVGMAARSIVYSGLRGVGKTVLLNALENKASDKGIQYKHIEIEDSKDFITQVIASIQAFIRTKSIMEFVKESGEKILDALKTLIVTYDPNTSAFSLSAQEKQFYQSTDLGQALTDAFVNMGEICVKTKQSFCFFIDEIQYIKKEELGALLVALHRCNQLGYPIMVICSGLPSVLKMLSDIKSYSERLFYYKTVDNLSKEDAEQAIVNPVKKIKVEYKREAIDKIIDITKGYPFFIQQLCEVVFNNTEGVITDYDVEIAIEEYYKVLDTGFYKVRYSRFSAGEKKFIKAIVDCGDLPCTIANIATHMKKEVTTISPVRGTLINKGIIYSVKHSELDFTVPEFDKYIKRLEEQ